MELLIERCVFFDLEWGFGRKTVGFKKGESRWDAMELK